jgi:hypothetical protein
MGKGDGNLARGFMAQIIEPTAVLGQSTRLPPLQALPAPRSLGESGLTGTYAGQGLVTALDNRLGLLPTNQHCSATVRRSNECIHAQIHTDHRTLCDWLVIDSTDQQDSPKAQSYFHQSPRHRSVVWQMDTQ